MCTLIHTYNVYIFVFVHHIIDVGIKIEPWSPHAQAHVFVIFAHDDAALHEHYTYSFYNISIIQYWMMVANHR
jgi:hypothetical protein